MQEFALNSTPEHFFLPWMNDNLFDSNIPVVASGFGPALVLANDSSLPAKFCQLNSIPMQHTQPRLILKTFLHEVLSLRAVSDIDRMCRLD
jgi:hypothetical protein